MIHLMGEDEGENAHLISERISQCYEEKISQEAIKELEKFRIPVGEVLKASETLNEEQIMKNGLFLKMEYPTMDKSFSVVGPAVELSKNPGQIKFRSPELGEHNQEILNNLGYSQEEIDELKLNRII